MSNDYPSSLVCKIFLLTALWGMILSGCSSNPEEGPGLRISNSGSVDIHGLVVLFPEESIAFGDVPAGTTTAYQNVPKGVFSYAAYQFEVNGQVVTQPVIDWIGERPLDGNSFTYTIDFDPNRTNTGERIRLFEVKKDD